MTLSRAPVTSQSRQIATVDAALVAKALREHHTHPCFDSIRPVSTAGGYAAASPHGQLKYVVNNDDRTWAEVGKATALYRGVGVDLPVYIMPVGGLIEDQQETAGKIADEAIARGYNLAARLQCYLYGNVIGT